MTDNGKTPLEVQDFQFKQINISQVCGEFPGVPHNRNLITADGKRGLLYIGYENKLICVKPASDSGPEWKLELNVPDRICKVSMSCDNSFLAVVFNQPSAIIYDANSIHKHTLDVLHEIRLSASVGSVSVVDLKWNPAIPEILCSITSDHTIGCFQVSRDKSSGVQIVGMEKPQGVEALCVSWSPKGKQIVVGCKNGDIIQLKPELKVARHLTAPNPSEGFVSSILWISNYQFCACYVQPSETRISVMIVDAPKGVTAPKYINYEDITFGSGSQEGLSYYFEHISEWGLIIAASSHSSEVAVLGTSDNGTTWHQWLLNDDSTAQIPLNRKKETENYPLGFAIDKSPVQKLPWGPESTLPNPVPILRILVTSGQLCSYHMVNLKEKAAAICSAPTETVAAPQLPRPSLGPSEISFNLNANITSTPRSKQASEGPPSKPKVTLNMFGDSSFSFPMPDNKTAEAAAQSQQFPAQTPGMFAQGDGKLSFPSQQQQQQQQISQPPMLSFAPPNQQQFKPAQAPQVAQPQPQQQQQPQQPLAQAPPKQAPVSIAQKPESNKMEPPKAPVGAPIAQQVQPKSSQATSSAPSKEEPATYDDSIYLRAYYEEQAKFEKELKNRLEPPPTWHCGSDEERELLVKRSDEMDEFLKELGETTNGLSSDIAYLKALLLQSFAWLEQGKSRSSASSDALLAGRTRADESKLAELQRRFYYTESQLNQAIKALDLEWAEYNSREATRMAIPKIEAIYQSLLKYGQIIQHERKNLDDLAKKWRSINRSSALDTSSSSAAAANLDKSMSGLSISSTGCSGLNDAAIELRCKLIAGTTKSFSREKQSKLRDLLCESAPRIVRAARPTAVQDRLEATLSSLASAKHLSAGDSVTVTRVIAKPSKSSDPAKSKTAPLSSLGNLVSGIGLSKSPSSTSPFGALAKPGESALQQQLSKPALTTSKAAAAPTQQLDNSFGFTNKQGTSADGSKTTTFSFSSPSATLPNFGSVTKPDNTTIFKLSTKPQASPSSPPQNQQQAASAFDLSSLMGFSGSKTTSALASPTPTMSLSFGKNTSPQQNPPFGAAQSPGISMFGKSAGSFDSKTASTAAASTGSSTAVTTTATSAGSSFGLSNMFGALGTSSGASSFSFTPASTPAASSATLTATTTAAISFGGSSTGPAASSPSLAALMNFSSATLGTPSSTAASSSPSVNIFASKAATSSPAPAASPIFGAATSTSTTSIFGAATAPITTSSISKSPSTGTSSLATFGTSTASSFSTPTATTATTTVASTPAIVSTTVAASTTSTTASVVPSTASTSITTSSSSSENVFFKSSAAASSTSATTTTTTSIFGGGKTPVATNSVFGGSASTPTFAAAATAPTSQQNNIFGAASPTTQSSSIFGGSTSAPLFGTAASGTSAFGATATTTSTPTFGTTATSTTTSAFGTTTTTSAALPSFGSSLTITAVTTTSPSAFGSPSSTPTTSTSSIFGTPASTTATTSPTSPTSVFGSAAPSSTNLFGGTTGSTSLFGQSAGSAPAFGATPTPSTTSSSVFGSGSVFGATASTASSSMFGGSSTGSVFSSGTGSVFGASATPTASIFGAGTAAASPSATGGTSVFGGSAAAPAATNVFGAASPSQAGGTSLFGAGTASPGGTGMFGAAPASQSVFGGGAALGSGTSMFGGGSAAAPAFGGAAAFGSKPVFGAPAAEFGGAAGFGAAPAFGAPSSPGFGSPSMMGGASPLGNTSPNKVFGSNTFETLGAQTGGLSFGSLAQKSPEAPKQQAFQGSTSFSSWR